jgi:hypothetical protein
MHPSVNYDYLMHGNHIHWCNVEAHGISRCEAQAMREHLATSTTDPLADVGFSLVIAIMITVVAGLVWGVRRGAEASDGQSAAATAATRALGISA